MKSTISNCIEIERPTKEILSWCENNLVLNNPLYMQLAKRQKWDVIRFKHVPEKMKFWERIGDKINIPFGCLYAIYDMIKNDEIILNFSSPKYNTIKDLPISSKIKLYDYQEEAVKKLCLAKGGVLKAGCGSGKTITGIELVHKIGERFLWIVHTKDLLNQARKDFLDLYPNMDIGLITEGEFDVGKDGAIATIQTLSKIDPKKYEHEFNVVIVDECHHCADRVDSVLMYKKVLSSMNPRYRYGLTATPYRQDGLTNTIYFNLGCNMKGKFEPTFSVERAKIKSLTAKVEHFDLDTPKEYYYTYKTKTCGSRFYQADDNGIIDLNHIMGTPISVSYSLCKEKLDLSKKEDCEINGIRFISSENKLVGLKKRDYYKISIEKEIVEQKPLFEADGTINYATLISYLTNNDDRNNKICNYIKELVGYGRKIAVLSQSVEHCNKMQNICKDLGINAACVTGKTKKSERIKTLENTENWDVIIATIALFKEGIDIKTLDTVIITTPMKDPSAIEQACGRCERYMDNKNQPLFIYTLDINFKYCYSVYNKMKSVISKRL